MRKQTRNKGKYVLLLVVIAAIVACVLVVFLPDVHESIAGLVAGKLKELYNRPSLVITRGEDGLKVRQRDKAVDIVKHKIDHKLIPIE